jgi:aspartate 1-decarboxylase
VQRQMLKSKIHRARVTYAIAGEPGSCGVAVNGAAALLVDEGDKIVASFGAYDERDLEAYAPIVVHVDEDNRIRAIDSHPEVLLGSPLASEADFAIPGELTPEAVR